MSNTTKSLIKSTLILGAAGVIVKIVGALYRIVLADFISLEGLSLIHIWDLLRLCKGGGGEL